MIPVTYPLKFRQQVLAIRQKENLTFKQTAERSGIGMATVMRWAKNPRPVTKRNKPATKIDMQLPAQDVAERPDAFLYERAERFSVTGTGIAHALKRLKISHKKNFPSSESR